MMYTPTHTTPNKSHLGEGLRASPLEGLATPFPAGTADCVQDHLFTIRGGQEDSAGRSSSHTQVHPFAHPWAAAMKSLSW